MKSLLAAWFPAKIQTKAPLCGAFAFLGFGDLLITVPCSRLAQPILMIADAARDLNQATEATSTGSFNSWFFQSAFARHLFIFLLLSFICALKEERLSALRLVEKLHSIIE